MNATTLKIGRIARAAGVLRSAKRVLASELVAEFWWNVAFLAMIFAAVAAPQVPGGLLLFAAAVFNLFLATQHRKAVERKSLKK